MVNREPTDRLDRRIRVLLADDHQIMRQGLRALLEAEQGIEVVAEAADGLEAVEKAAEYSVDVVVMDLNMPGMNGIEATREIAARAQEPRVLALSMVLDRPYVVETLKAGATGYLLKDCAATELTTAIRAVAAGEPYLSAQITALIIQDYTRSEESRSAEAGARLSDGERDVLQRIADGQSTKEIAYERGVSVKTVETQRTNIMKKLNLFSIAELTKFAVREGLTSL